MKLKDKYKVERIEYEDTKEYILTKHYAQRMPSISFAFGLFLKNNLVGVLTIGKPASHTLCTGILGKEYASQVYELNRLITEDGLDDNVLSFFCRKKFETTKIRGSCNRILRRFGNGSFKVYISSYELYIYGSDKRTHR